MRKVVTLFYLLLIYVSMAQANANTDNLYERLVNDWSNIFPDGNRNAAGPLSLIHI